MDCPVFVRCDLKRFHSLTGPVRLQAKSMIDAGVSMSNFRGCNGIFQLFFFFQRYFLIQLGGDGLFRCYFMLLVGSSSHVKDFGVAMVHLDWT